MSTSFQYSIPDGRKEIASVDKTWWHNYVAVNTAHDPAWITSASSHPEPWLGYRAHDGRLWFSRISATHWHASRIKFTFEHRGPVPPGWSGDPKTLPKNGNSNDDGHMGYIDWDGNKKYLVVNDLDIDSGEEHAASPTLSILPA